MNQVRTKSPKFFHRIRVKYWIATDEWHLFHHGLGYQKSVKGISMMKRQRDNGHQVVHLYR